MYKISIEKASEHIFYYIFNENAKVLKHNINILFLFFPLTHFHYAIRFIFHNRIVRFIDLEVYSSPTLDF